MEMIFFSTYHKKHLFQSHMSDVILVMHIAN